MAKSNSIFNFQGTVQNVTHVDSKAYGKHVRSPRGTHKPAVINEAFKQSGKELVNANLTAKMIKDALDPHREGFRDGTLWQRLLSVIKKEHKHQRPSNLNVLEGFQLYKTNPLDRYLAPIALYHIDASNNTLHITIGYEAHPDFKRYKRIDSYRLKLVALFPNLKLKTAATAEISFAVIHLSNPVIELKATLPMPPQSDSVLLCLRLDGCIQGEPVNNQKTKGMAILKTGIGEKDVTP